jgi:hypothetical protein
MTAAAAFPQWLRAFLGECTWMLPFAHLGAIGMLLLTAGGISGRADVTADLT